MSCVNIPQGWSILNLFVLMFNYFADLYFHCIFICVCVIIFIYLRKCLSTCTRLSSIPSPDQLRVAFRYDWLDEGAKCFKWWTDSLKWHMLRILLLVCSAAIFKYIQSKQSLKRHLSSNVLNEKCIKIKVFTYVFKLYM